MPSSSGGALRRLAAETLVPDSFAAADVDFGGRRTNETREVLEVGLSASGPSSSNCFHERGIPCGAGFRFLGRVAYHATLGRGVGVRAVGRGPGQGWGGRGQPGGACTANPLNPET